MLAHRVAGESHEARFETRLVAIRRVHVAELVVGRHRAAAGADGDERAVVALLPRRQPLEIAQRAAAMFLQAPVDVAGGLQRLAGESRAREERPVRADRVGVALVDLARAHVHAIGRRKAALLRLLAEKRHLVVDEIAGVAHAADASAGRRHARAVERLAFAADRGERDDALGRRALFASLDKLGTP